MNILQRRAHADAQRAMRLALPHIRQLGNDCDGGTTVILIPERQYAEIMEAAAEGERRLAEVNRRRRERYATRKRGTKHNSVSTSRGSGPAKE